MKKYYLVIFLFLGLSACEKSSNTLVAIPTVNISCNSSDNSQCSTATFTCTPREATVYMTRSGCGDSNSQFSPLAGGTTSLSCDTNGCTGSVSSWVDDNGNPVSEVLTGSISVCSYIDLNCSDIDDSGDLVDYQETVFPVGDPMTVDTWSVR